MKKALLASVALAFALGFSAGAMAGDPKGIGHGVQGCSAGGNVPGPLTPGKFFQFIKANPDNNVNLVPFEGMNPKQILDAGGFDGWGNTPATVGAALDVYCPPS